VFPAGENQEISILGLKRRNCPKDEGSFAFSVHPCSGTFDLSDEGIKVRTLPAF
jgi:hypothetical protein